MMNLVASVNRILDILLHDIFNITAKTAFNGISLSKIRYS